MDMNLNKKKGESGGQKNLVCSSLWGCKELDVTQQPNNYSSLPDTKLKKEGIKYWKN